MKYLAIPQTGEQPTGFFQNAAGVNRGANYGWGTGTCVLRTPHGGVAAMLSPGSFGHGGAWVVDVLMVQRANFPSSDASEVRRVFQQAAAEALGKR